MYLQDQDNIWKRIVILDETTISTDFGVKEAGPFAAACLLSGLYLIS